MLHFEKKFKQSILNAATGEMNPGGFCFGLAVYWIVAHRNKDENRFWADIEKSITPTGSSEETPLVYGEGYASLAGRFQRSLGDEWHENAKGLLTKEAKLKRTEIFRQKDKNFFTDKIAISDILWPLPPEKPSNYIILVVCAESGSHAIGLIQDEKRVKLFDPNCGVLVCDGGDFDNNFDGLMEILQMLNQGYRSEYQAGYEIFRMYES